MANMLKSLTIAALTVLAFPTAASARDPLQAVEQARQDRKTNEGFSTARTTQPDGNVRYAMNGSNVRRLQSSEEAERQFERGHDAYANGAYGSACLAFRHAKNLYARARDREMSETSASLARDACTMARANGTGARSG